MSEHDDFWSFDVRSTGEQIARAPKEYRYKGVRRLFGDRIRTAHEAGSPIFNDNFTDLELIRAIGGGVYQRKAAITIIGLRARINDNGLVPEISVRKPVSREVVEAILAQASSKGEIGLRNFPGFRALLPGASAETADLIYPILVERLYAPFKATKPFGPWFYGNRWREQARDKRPNMVTEYVRNDYVPVFAAAASFRYASAVVLRLGQPYIKRFYDEFKTEILNRTFENSGPSYYTTILARSETDISGVISEIRSRPMTPVLYGTLWALVEQAEKLPEALIEELRTGCEADQDFLNDPVASKKYLGGKSFCSHYLQDEGSDSVP